MKSAKYYLYTACLLCSGCATTKSVVSAPVRFIKNLFGGNDTALPEDPYAIWQEYAIYIIIGGIIIGVIDFAMDRKLTWIGPAIFACGLVVSIWGVALNIVATILPWALGLAVLGWVILRVVNVYKLRKS